MLKEVFSLQESFISEFCLKQVFYKGSEERLEIWHAQLGRDFQAKACCRISKYFQSHGVERGFEAIGEDLPV